MTNLELIGGLLTLTFTLGFTGIVVWAYWPKNKAKIQAHGQIPFKDEVDDNE
ncbi:MAG: cbb3-type cytochrome c oxidase subunit 3 [Asticcacaulis sp.]